MDIEFSYLLEEYSQNLHGALKQVFNDLEFDFFEVFELWVED